MKTKGSFIELNEELQFDCRSSVHQEIEFQNGILYPCKVSCY